MSEELGEDEAGPIATARFSVMLERRSGERASFEVTEEAMPLDDALIWARGRASRVLVRRGGFGDHPYTAADVPDEDERPLAEALPVEPRRLPGWEFVDRTPSHPPISWDVVVEAYCADPTSGKWAPFDGAAGERWAASLAAAPIEVVQARSDWALGRRSGRTWLHPAEFAVAVLRVQARTVEEARSVTAAAVSASIGTVTTSTAWGLRAAAAYPTGSGPARHNARLGAT